MLLAARKLGVFCEVRGVSKLDVPNEMVFQFVSHVLVKLVYVLFCGSFGIEIFSHKHRESLTPKIPWAKKVHSILGRVPKLATVKQFS